MRDGDVHSFQRLISTFKTINPISQKDANPLFPNYLRTLQDLGGTLTESIVDDPMSDEKIKKFQFFDPQPLPNQLYVSIF